MTNFDVAVLIDAHHLLGVPARDGSARKLMARIESTTSFVALAGSISHRSMVADCTDARVQPVVTDYARNAGFRVRHCPDISLCGQTIVAEAVEAIHLNPAIRTIVFVTTPTGIGPVIDVLHRLGRSVIVLTTDPRGQDGAIDSVIELPLDTSVVAETVLAALADVEGNGVTSVPVEDLERAVRARSSSFEPRLLGCRTFVQVLERLDRRSLLLTDGGRLVERLRADLRPTPGTNVRREPAVNAIGAPTLEETLARVAGELGERRAQTAEELTAALDALLGATTEALGESEVLAAGVALNPHLRKAFGRVVPGYRREDAQVGFLELCRRTVTRRGTWSVAAQDDKPTNIRVFFGPPPSGFRFPPEPTSSASPQPVPEPRDEPSESNGGRHAVVEREPGHAPGANGAHPTPSFTMRPGVHVRPSPAPRPPG